MFFFNILLDLAFFCVRVCVIISLMTIMIIIIIDFWNTENNIWQHRTDENRIKFQIFSLLRMIVFHNFLCLFFRNFFFLSNNYAIRMAYSSDHLFELYCIRCLYTISWWWFQWYKFGSSKLFFVFFIWKKMKFIPFIYNRKKLNTFFLWFSHWNV